MVVVAASPLRGRLWWFALVCFLSVITSVAVAGRDDSSCRSSIIGWSSCDVHDEGASSRYRCFDTSVTFELVPGSSVRSADVFAPPVRESCPVSLPSNSSGIRGVTTVWCPLEHVRPGHPALIGFFDAEKKYVTMVEVVRSVVEVPTAAGAPDVFPRSVVEMLQEADEETVEPQNVSCVHGTLSESGECVCERNYYGELCDSACPGLQAGNGCSDAGCYGKSEAECRDECVFNVSLGFCVGVRSCVLNVCGGHGVCDWGVNGTGSCICDSGYIGATCTIACSSERCVAMYGVARARCKSDGSCGCADDAGGHFGTLENLCLDCADGWYGAGCDKRCPCNGHGRCDQENATCTCYNDDTNGHWGGPSCGVCVSTYMGEGCTVPNTVFTVASTSQHSFEVSSSPAQRYPLQSGVFVVNDTGLFVAGYGHVLMCGDLWTGHTNPDVYRDLGDDAVVWDSAWDNRGALMILVTQRVNDTVQVHVLRNASISHTTLVKDCSFPIESTWSINLTDPEVDIVDGKVSPHWGWILVSESGELFVQDRSLEPPSDTFLARSVFVDNLTGFVFVSGSDGGRWAVAMTNMTEWSPLVFIPRESWSDGENYDVALRSVVVESLLHVALRQKNGSNRLAVVQYATVDLVFPEQMKVSSSVSVEVSGRIDYITLWWRATPRTLYVTLNTQSQTLFLGIRKSPALNILSVASQQQLSFSANSFYARMTVVEKWGLFSLFRPSMTTSVFEISLLTTYATTSVTPARVGRSAGTKITVTGVNFVNGYQCVFGGSRNVSATLKSATTLECVVPTLEATTVCGRISVEVASSAAPVFAPTASGVSVGLVVTPGLTSAVGPAGGAYTSIFATSPIAVFGQGFRPLTPLSCRFADNGSMNLFSAATYISAGQVNCSMPSDVSGPSVGLTGTVAVSLDGVQYSNSVPFTFVGPASALQMTEPVHISLHSASLVAFDPPPRVQVVDAEGHPLRELDVASDNRVVTVSAVEFNSSRIEVSRVIDPMESLVFLTYTNQTRLGETSFTVSLQYPLMGIGTLQFESDDLAPTSMHYTVYEGAPSRMKLLVPPSSTVDNRNIAAARQPVLAFTDAAGNTISNFTDVSALPTEVYAVFFGENGSLAVARSSPVNGSVCFTDVFPVQYFGQQGVVTFLADGYSEVRSPVMTVAYCYPDQYGVPWTTLCAPCPPYAVCNGSYEFNASDGYWRGGPLAYGVSPCLRLGTCVNGGCNPRYDGPLCTLCSSGHGKLGQQCVRCLNVATNVVVFILLVFIVGAVAMCVVLLAFQSAGPNHSIVGVLIILLDYLQTTTVVVSPTVFLPDFVEQYIAIVRLLSLGDVLRLSPLDCLFHMSAHIRFVVAIVTPIVGVQIIQILLVYIHRWSLKRRIRILRRRARERSLAPFDSEQAYHARLAHLGLEEEPVFGEQTSAAIEELEPQNAIIRQAYAQLDKNSHAIASMNKLSPSNARNVALQMLFEEQEELLQTLEQVEACVSSGEVPPPALVRRLFSTSRNATGVSGRAAAPPPTSSSVIKQQLQQHQQQQQQQRHPRAPQRPSLESSLSGQIPSPGAAAPSSGGGGGGGGKRSGKAVAAEHTTAAAATASAAAAGAGTASATPAAVTAEPGASVATPPAVMEAEPQGSLRTRESASMVGGLSALHPGVTPMGSFAFTNEDEPGECSPGGSIIVVDSTSKQIPLWRRALGFPLITETRSTLMEELEMIDPIPVDFEMRDREEHSKEAPIGPQLTRRSNIRLRWPPFSSQMLMVSIVLIRFSFIPMLYYSFSLIPCHRVSLGVSVGPSPKENVQSLLYADHSINCDSATHRSFRTAAIVLSSLGTMSVLLLEIRFVFSRTVPRNVLSRLLLRCLGLRQQTLWWDLVILLRQFVLVALVTLIPQHQYLVLLVVMWVLVGTMTVNHFLSPHQSPRHTMCGSVTDVALLLTAMLQLLPFLVGGSPPSYAVQEAAGVLMVMTVVVTTVVVSGFLMMEIIPFTAMAECTANVAQQLKQCRLCATYHRLTNDDASEKSEPRPVDRIAELPFSFETYNAAFVVTAAQAVTKREQQMTSKDGAETDFTMDISSAAAHAAPVAMRGLYPLLHPGKGTAGAVGAAGTTGWMEEFVRSNEVQLEQHELSTVMPGEGSYSVWMSDTTCLRTLKTEVEWERDVITEHANQLERVIQQLDHILKTQVQPRDDERKDGTA